MLKIGTFGKIDSSSMLNFFTCIQWSCRDIALDNAEECEYYMAYQ
jgi:hypothetical protein